MVAAAAQTLICLLFIFIADEFSVATIEIGEPIPSDVHHNINESLELKCLLDAHFEKLKEVTFEIYSFILLKLHYI